MLANFVFFMMLISGSVYAAIRYEKRFEQTMPVCVIAIVLILFAFGLMGILEIGMFVLYALAIGFYFLTAAQFTNKWKFGGVLKNS